MKKRLMKFGDMWIDLREVEGIELSTSYYKEDSPWCVCVSLFSRNSFSSEFPTKDEARNEMDRIAAAVNGDDETCNV